jgi:hypothetical protein
MCTLLYATLPATADHRKVQAVAERFGFRFTPSSKRALTTHLDPGELVLDATRAYGCDCGTELGAGDQVAAARYRKRGWSEAKIERALADKARSRPQPVIDLDGPGPVDWAGDSPPASAWLALLREILVRGWSPYVGLIVHVDRGERHPLKLKGRERLPVAGLTEAGLRGLREEWLYEVG